MWGQGFEWECAQLGQTERCLLAFDRIQEFQIGHLVGEVHSTCTQYWWWWNDDYHRWIQTKIMDEHRGQGWLGDMDEEKNKNVDEDETVLVPIKTVLTNTILVPILRLVFVECGQRQGGGGGGWGRECEGWSPGGHLDRFKECKMSVALLLHCNSLIVLHHHWHRHHQLGSREIDGA